MKPALAPRSAWYSVHVLGEERVTGHRLRERERESVHVCVSERARERGEEREREGRSERGRECIPFPSDAAERFTHAWKSLK